VECRSIEIPKVVVQMPMGQSVIKYCSYCYENGSFTYEGTVADFQEFCRIKMIEGGHSRFTAWLFSRGMKRLERWKN